MFHLLSVSVFLPFCISLTHYYHRRLRPPKERFSWCHHLHRGCAYVIDLIKKGVPANQGVEENPLKMASFTYSSWFIAWHYIPCYMFIIISSSITAIKPRRVDKWERERQKLSFRIQFSPLVFAHNTHPNHQLCKPRNCEHTLANCYYLWPLTLPPLRRRRRSSNAKFTKSNIFSPWMSSLRNFPNWLLNNNQNNGIRLIASVSKYSRNYQVMPVCCKSSLE